MPTTRSAVVLLVKPRDHGLEPTPSFYAGADSRISGVSRTAGSRDGPFTSWRLCDGQACSLGGMGGVERWRAW